MIAISLAALACGLLAILSAGENKPALAVGNAALSVFLLWFALTLAGCTATQHCPQTYGYDTFTSRPSNPW